MWCRWAAGAGGRQASGGRTLAVGLSPCGRSVCVPHGDIRLYNPPGEPRWGPPEPERALNLFVADRRAAEWGAGRLLGDAPSRCCCGEVESSSSARSGENGVCGERPERSPHDRSLGGGESGEAHAAWNWRCSDFCGSPGETLAFPERELSERRRSPPGEKRLVARRSGSSSCVHVVLKNCESSAAGSSMASARRFPARVPTTSPGVPEAIASRRSASALPSMPPVSRSIRLLMEEFQWFLIELSVRPGRSLAISAHLLPRTRCARMMMSSSAVDQASLLISGLR